MADTLLVECTRIGMNVWVPIFGMLDKYKAQRFNSTYTKNKLSKLHLILHVFISIYARLCVCKTYYYVLKTVNVVKMGKTEEEEQEAAEYLLDVNVWSHQSDLQRNAFKSSAVRPTMTTGGATIVRTNRPIPTQKQIIPNRFKSVASVIFTALAERTRNTTEILQIVLERREEEKTNPKWNDDDDEYDEKRPKPAFLRPKLDTEKIPPLNAFKHFQANLSNTLSILSFLYNIKLQLYFVDTQLISKKVLFLWAKPVILSQNSLFYDSKPYFSFLFSLSSLLVTIEGCCTHFGWKNAMLATVLFSIL